MKLLISCLFALTVGAYCAEIDYYWRDFYGEIPIDAVPGGTDLSGQTTYIAQLFVSEHGVLPTRLYQGETTVTGSLNGIYTSDKNIKILCSRNIGNFRWITVTGTTLHSDLLDMENLYLVEGGTEKGFTTYIGRQQYMGELIVGKVCSFDLAYAGMYFPYNGTEYLYLDYEILTYDSL